MQPYQIIIDILDKPEAPKNYRKFKEYLEKNNMLNEASAIGYLIEKKFGKNNVIISNDSSDITK